MFKKVYPLPENVVAIMERLSEGLQQRLIDLYYHATLINHLKNKYEEISTRNRRKIG